MAIQATSAPRILIIRRDNIGDLVCTTPLFEALRRTLPHARIAALANSYNAEVLARNPSVDAVFAYEKLKHRSGGLVRHLFGAAKLRGRLRAERFDCVLVPAPSPQSRGIAERLGASQVLVSPSAVPAGVHEVERTFALAEPLGVRGDPGPLRVYADETLKASLKKKLSLTAPIAIHISARRPAQRWPRERYAELVRELARERQVMLLWAPGASDDPRHPGDDEAAQWIAARAPCTAVPTPDLATLVAALSLAGNVVSPDGGAMHVAAGLGRPVVALFGDSPVERWRPWAVPHKVVQPPSRHLKDLPLRPVLDALEALQSAAS